MRLWTVAKQRNVSAKRVCQETNTLYKTPQCKNSTDVSFVLSLLHTDV